MHNSAATAAYSAAAHNVPMRAHAPTLPAPVQAKPFWQPITQGPGCTFARAWCSHARGLQQLHRPTWNASCVSARGGGGVTMFPTRLTHTHVTLLLQGAITATPVLEQRSTTTLHQGTSCLGSLGCVTNAQLMVMADACDCDLLAAAPARGKQSTQKARRCVVHSVRVETECMSAY